MNSNIQQNKLHDYFLLLEESLADFFKMEDCFLFHLIDNNLKPVTNLNYYNIDFNLLVPYLNGNKVVELPKFLKELSYFRNHTNIMPLMSNNKIDGIIVFKYKKTTPLSKYN